MSYNRYWLRDDLSLYFLSLVETIRSFEFRHRLTFPLHFCYKTLIFIILPEIFLRSNSMNRPSFVNCILFSLFHFGPISLFDLGGQKSYSFIDDWICFDFWNFCFFWRSLSAGLSTALSQLLRPESAEIIMNDLLSNSVAHWVLLSENLFYSLLRTCNEP